MSKRTKTTQEMEREGWKMASVTGGAHLKRTMEMYKEMGFETYLEAVNPEECAGCTACYKSANETIYRIYTKAQE